MKATGFSAKETVLVGDRLYTDIACGVNAGISTIFVLSGEGTMEDVKNSDTKPEFIYDNIRKIYDDIL
jgi:ribonucleotide monophosphatase NagD (HAD superfamily)